MRFETVQVAIFMIPMLGNIQKNSPLQAECNQ